MNALEFKDKIRALRLGLGASMEDIARAVGVSKPTVQRWESGEIVNMRRDKIWKLAQALHTSPAYLMGWEEGPPEISNVTPMPSMREVPRLGAIACGEPILAEQNIEGYDQVPDWVRCDFTLTCRGDSMINARIHDGDMVCIKSQPEVENGQIAAVLVDGEFESGATLKRVRYIEGGLALWPENPAYEPMIFTGSDVEKVRILGLATHFVSRVV